ncbi:MAG: hypothetical protein J5846_08065 [Desulfovibrio sp.]|nr:hypothetical protein [Desulfovibrio sp.]
MKRCLIFVLVLLLGVRSLIWADDSGDELTIPVLQWRCELCNAEYFTFAPDDIGYQSQKAVHKDMTFQQANWMRLKDPGTSIPKCSKLDGAHLFRLMRSLNTSGMKIAQNMHAYVVSKESRDLKAALLSVHCGLCGLQAKCFAGDDLDSYSKLNLTEKLHLFHVYDKSSVPPCKGKLASGRDCVAHVFLVDRKLSINSSMELARQLRSVICSD